MIDLGISQAGNKAKRLGQIQAVSPKYDKGENYELFYAAHDYYFRIQH